VEQANSRQKQPATCNLQLVTADGFALRKDFGIWVLTHRGQNANLKHEIGLEYIAFLMAHPNQEFHGLELALKVRAAREGTPGREDTLNERAMALDDAEAARRLYRKQRELEGLIDDENTIEAVRDEAYEQLKAILEFQKKNVSKTSSQAQKASHAVGMAIKRLYKRLSATFDAHGNPPPVLRAFANYIYDHILFPSGRSLSHGGPREKISGGYFRFTP
jgi:hypothetical protein